MNSMHPLLSSARALAAGCAAARASLFALQAPVAGAQTTTDQRGVPGVEANVGKNASDRGLPGVEMNVGRDGDQNNVDIGRNGDQRNIGTRSLGAGPDTTRTNADGTTRPLRTDRN